MKLLAEEVLFSLIDEMPADVSTDDHESLSQIAMTCAEIAQFQTMDPFGADYHAACSALYSRISNVAAYDPAKNEDSGYGVVENVWKGVTPYSFQSSRFLAEFLESWSAIFAALDMKAGDSILEYGPGSGQILLMLARSGMAAHGVDIDADSLTVVRRQSDLMGLDVALDQGEFGAGFGDRRFDRILFFEAFHHALKFDELLIRLHDRLAPGGRLVLCGEPIVPPGNAAVPYPWGPRLDALSVYCIRRRGWMELGFQHDFFLTLMMRSGWKVQYRPMSGLRSATYIAEPIGDVLELGADIALPPGWGGPEGAHRWTISQEARLPLPNRRRGRFDLVVELVNHLPAAKEVALSVADLRKTVSLQPGEATSVSFEQATGDELLIKTELTGVAPPPPPPPTGWLSRFQRPEPPPEPTDSRRLGVAVKRCLFS